MRDKLINDYNAFKSLGMSDENASRLAELLHIQSNTELCDTENKELQNLLRIKERLEQTA